MPGPPPKDPALRVRRNKVATRAKIPAGMRARKRPLPRRTPAWHPETRREWNVWWASPQASQWTDIHAAGLFRLIVLVDDFWRAATLRDRKEAMTEIRLWGTEFGLTLMAERKLQLERIHEEDDLARKAKAVPPPPPPSGDPRLRLVKPA